MLEALKKQNQNIEILDVLDGSFEPYGKVINQEELPKMTAFVEGQKMPEDEIYIPCSNELTSLDEAEIFTKKIYGQVPCQIGYYLATNNTKLNAFEYHKCSEVLVVLEDEILLLGKIEEIQNDCYDTQKVKAFYAKKGMIIEIYATTLHFAPAMVNKKNGVRQIVVLSKNTNTPLNEKIEDKTGENKFLLEKNKWVLAHKDAKNLIEQGAYIGLKGENIEIKPLLD